MKSKTLKVVVMIVMLLNIYLVIETNVYASTLFGNIQSSAENFLQTGKNNQKIDASTAKTKILPIANMLVGIATVVFLIVGGIMGVQYMISGANERAQLKQKLIWFVISVVVVYGSAGIFNIAVSIMLKVTGE